MSVTTAKFTLEQYERMVELGSFGPPYEMRVELLHGEIVEMSPIGFEHGNAVAYLTRWSCEATDKAEVIVRPQCALRLSASNSAPEPDLAWVQAKKYARQPNPDEVLLVIEVAKTSLDADRGDKLAAYAEAGIADYWIVNLVDKQVEVYRQPSGKSYAERTIHSVGDTGPSPLAQANAVLNVAALFAEI